MKKNTAIKTKFKAMSAMIAIGLTMSVFTGCSKTNTGSVLPSTTGAGAADADAVQTAVTGFTSDENVPKHLVVVYGYRKTSAYPDLSVLVPYFEQIYSSGGSLDVIIPDSRPANTMQHFEIERVDTKLSSANRKDKIKSGAMQLTSTIVSTMKPKTQEADVIEAFNLSARTIVKYSDEKMILAFDSGITTTGTMIMESFKDFDAESSVKKLDGCISEFDGVEIVWYCFGCTAGIQQPLRESDRANLERFWKAFFNEGGTTNVSFYTNGTAYLTEEQEKSVYDDLPDVSAVEISEAVKSVKYEPAPETDTDVPIQETMKDKVIDFPSDMMFDSNSYVIKDREKAKKDLAKFANQLNKSPEFKIILIGCTAHDPSSTEESCRSFGLKRAEAMKDVLTELGVSPDQILTAGAGYSDESFYTYDLFDDGTLDESIAPNNRKVVACSTDMTCAQPYVK